MMLHFSRAIITRAQYPAHFVACDVLRDARGRELLDQPLAGRRRRLKRLLASACSQLTLCPQTRDEKIARSWLADWSASGIEGLLVKPSFEAVLAFEESFGAARRARGGRRAAGELAAMASGDSARAAVVHGH
ncbi:hypothetical protein AB0368_36480, partial [Actinoplanes sp. NPDC051475]